MCHRASGSQYLNDTTVFQNGGIHLPTDTVWLPVRLEERKTLFPSISNTPAAAGFLLSQSGVIRESDVLYSTAM